MIVAIVVVDPLPAVKDAENPGGVQPYFLKSGGQSVLEHAVSRVLRGPFGGTIVAVAEELEEPCREALDGFAVQFASADDARAVEKAGLLEAAAFRQRWEKARSLAAARFGGAGGNPRERRKGRSGGDDDGESDDWKRHADAEDVKVRGLAQSFECNGVMLFRGERAGLKLETQAALIDAYSKAAREKPGFDFARVIHDGAFAYPLFATVKGARELEGLGLDVPVEAYLTRHAGRVLQAPCADPAPFRALKSAADFTRAASKA
jgi:CTP:molybdopterin cytidylyltransferase MocA